MRSMNQQPISEALAENAQDDYEQLPEPIKMIYTRTEYLWLSDAEKADLVQRECEPEF